MSSNYNTIADTNSTTAFKQSQNKYVRSGIGGAGNFRKATPTVSVTAPIVIPLQKGHFYSGIGGHGNSRPHSQRSSISLEEEVSREVLRKESAPSSFHLGIGGRGNRASSVSGSITSSPRGSFSSSSNPSEKRRLSSYFKI